MRYLKKYENFDRVAFHGFMMTPKDMRLPACEIEWKDPSQDTGCPRFSNEEYITREDENKAIEYLNEEEIGEIIGYSRGGAILMKALNRGARRPKSVCMVAPAWKRKWSDELNGDELNGIEGFVIHGGKDNKVPLRHSAILARESGLPLYVFPEANHVNILKYTKRETVGILIDSTKIQYIIDILPDWKKEESTTAQLEQQYSIVKNNIEIL